MLEKLGVREREYALLTLHRPSNVDDPRTLAPLLATIDEIAKKTRVVFPVHPRTRARIAEHGVVLDPSRWSVVEPLGYLDFLTLTASARVVLTDSGGIQEETTVLGVPCITLRENTERPVTISEGTNVLRGDDAARRSSLPTKRRRRRAAGAPTRVERGAPPLGSRASGDGHVALRIEDRRRACARFFSRDGRR